MASPVHNLVCERGVIALGIAEALKRRHLNKIEVPVVDGDLSTVPDSRACCGKKGLSAFDALYVVGARRVEHRPVFFEGNGVLPCLASPRVRIAQDFDGANDERRFLPPVLIRLEQRSVSELHPLWRIMFSVYRLHLHL